MRAPLLALMMATICGPAVARDINRQRYLLGERASGMGGAFVALGGDPVSTYYNPAGLAALKRGGVSLSASAYQLSGETYDKILEVGPVRASMQSSEFSTFPSSIVYVLPIGGGGGESNSVLAFSVLAPDYDKSQPTINLPIGDLALEMKGKFYLEDVTYWVGPSYAWTSGDWRFGGSLFLLAHQTTSRSSLGLKFATTQAGGGLLNTFGTNTTEYSGLSVTGLLQLGVQYRLNGRWRLGATLRTPTLGTIYSDLEAVSFNSSFSEENPDQTFVDRIELGSETRSSINFQQPLEVAVGLSRTEGDTRFDVDLTVYAPIAEYRLFDGPTQYPTDATGAAIEDASRGLSLVQTRATRAQANLNAGAETALSETTALRVGVFTDRSMVDRAYYQKTAARRGTAVTLPYVDRYGVSAALGLGSAPRACDCPRTTTSIGLIMAYGVGSTPQLSEVFGAPAKETPVSSYTVTAVLSGSADL